MIHAIYIIDGESGLHLLFRKYGEIELDEALVSGFLTAIKHFSCELKKGKKEGEADTIQEIEMKTYKIVIHASEENILVAAITDWEDSTQLVRKALVEAALSFSDRYRLILKNWNGDSSVFLDFVPELDKILMEGRVGEALRRPKLKGKLMKSMVRMGFVSEDAFRVSELCDGKHTKEAIADNLKLPLEKVIEAIRELEKKNLLEWV